MKNIVPVIVGIAAIVSAIGTAIANANGPLGWVPMLYALSAVLFVAALVIGIYNSQREASQALNPPRNSIQMGPRHLKFDFESYRHYISANLPNIDSNGTDCLFPWNSTWKVWIAGIALNFGTPFFRDAALQLSFPLLNVSQFHLFPRYTAN